MDRRQQQQWSTGDRWQTIVTSRLPAGGGIESLPISEKKTQVTILQTLSIGLKRIAASVCKYTAVEARVENGF